MCWLMTAGRVEGLVMEAEMVQAGRDTRMHHHQQQMENGGADWNAAYSWRSFVETRTQSGIWWPPGPEGLLEERKNGSDHAVVSKFESILNSDWTLSDTSKENKISILKWEFGCGFYTWGASAFLHQSWIGSSSNTRGCSELPHRRRFDSLCWLSRFFFWKSSKPWQELYYGTISNPNSSSDSVALLLSQNLA